MPPPIVGLHHVTAIASDPQTTLDFYTQVLGLRFVKRTVNFDDPGSYHFYFGDDLGSPGTILTFFAWPGAAKVARESARPRRLHSVFRILRSISGKGGSPQSESPQNAWTIVSVILY